mmetsp:Transcript_2426/g.5412  ORF Transcript_2426/g.5412 Transcript_2426/m.5412 type:complete len:220 (-) Transcript_2426:468-1127(-)
MSDQTGNVLCHGFAHGLIVAAAVAIDTGRIEAFDDSCEAFHRIVVSFQLRIDLAEGEPRRGSLLVPKIRRNPVALVVFVEHQCPLQKPRGPGDLADLVFFSILQSLRPLCKHPSLPAGCTGATVHVGIEGRAFRGPDQVVDASIDFLPPLLFFFFCGGSISSNRVLRRGGGSFLLHPLHQMESFPKVCLGIQGILLDGHIQAPECGASVSGRELSGLEL